MVYPWPFEITCDEKKNERSQGKCCKNGPEHTKKNGKIMVEIDAMKFDVELPLVPAN